MGKLDTESLAKFRARCILFLMDMRGPNENELTAALGSYTQEGSYLKEQSIVVAVKRCSYQMIS